MSQRKTATKTTRLTMEVDFCLRLRMMEWGKYRSPTPGSSQDKIVQLNNTITAPRRCWRTLTWLFFDAAENVSWTLSNQRRKGREVHPNARVTSKKYPEFASLKVFGWMLARWKKSHEDYIEIFRWLRKILSTDSGWELQLRSTTLKLATWLPN